MNMSQEQVVRRVTAVARMADLDDEKARDGERELWADVLVAAADGQDVRTLAQQALATRAHVFARHGRS